MTEQIFLGLGAYLYGALALIGVFVLGLHVNEIVAAEAAVFAAGAAYAAQFAGALGKPVVGMAFTALSVAAGFYGFALIVL